MKQSFTLAVALLAAVFTFAQDNWPKTFRSENGSTISIYEPQPEYLSGNEFTGRAAIAVRKNAGNEPVFGAILFTATMKNRGEAKNVEVGSMRVTRLKFSSNETADAGLAREIEEHAASWNWGMTMQELEQAVAREQETTGEGFNNRPPKIIYVKKPSTLVVIDGDPKVLYDKELATDKVVNSPNIIFKDKGEWQLYAGGNWYQSNSITNGWKLNNNLSAKVRSVNEQIKKQEKENNENKPLENKPRATQIIVTTEPAELIQTDGEPVYRNVAGTSLLYVSNSPNDIFKDIESQKTYTVLAGRWYAANNLQGPWEYVPSDRLPEDFAKIPEGSDKDGVLANVAGTEAAETAILDASIPQTAKVDRRSAQVDVQYDGEPEFAPIRGTSLRLAENANVTVMEDADGNYFALDNGIWFISDNPYGPWQVANDRPRDLDAIPASSPAYYSRYVYVYDVTPDYVYMGYTPGYLGCYVYGPTIVYGTGYHYRPWFRRVYYPRPFTWGFGFAYNPWWGWNINFGYNFGYTYVGFWYDRPAYYGWGGGWFGPYRYCPAYRRPYWSGGYYGRGDYYYGRNSYYNRNYYGSATRPSRPYYGSGNNGARPDRLGNNLYVNQPGVSSRNITRASRVYRPDGQSALNTSRPVNGRYTNRISQHNRNVPSPNNSMVRPDRGRDARTPSVSRPQQNGDRPVTNQPSRVQRPAFENGQNNDQRDRVERPSGDQRSPRVQQPSANDQSPRVQQPERVQRPAFENRQPEQRSGSEQRAPRVQQPSNEQRSPRVEQSERVQRPSFEGRQPVQRPSYESRQPVQRPAESRPAPRVEQSPRAQRPAFESRPAPSGGGSQRQTIEHSRRPDRR